MIHLLLATSLSLQPLDTSRIRSALTVTPVSFATTVANTAATAAAPQDTARPIPRALPFGDDKVQHFFTTYAVYSFSYGGDRAIGLSRKAALIDAGVAALAVGIGKEVYDQMHGKRFSGYDLIADALGGAAAFFTLKQVR